MCFILILLEDSRTVCRFGNSLAVDVLEQDGYVGEGIPGIVQVCVPDGLLIASLPEPAPLVVTVQGEITVLLQGICRV